MLRYDFALSRNAFLVSRTVIASKSYCSEDICTVVPVIASYSYRSDVIGKRCHIDSLSLLGKIAFKNKCNKTLFWSSRQKYTQKYNRKSFRLRLETNIFV
jgi:hypothetical protein